MPLSGDWSEIMVQASIVIRAFNEERHIAKLLTGLRQQVDVACEFILVDSGSTDSTVSIAKQFGANVVSISPADFTFGRALNLGCEAASHDLIVIASAHVYPLHCDWLSQLLAPFQDNQIALTYGRQVGDQVSKYSETRLFAKWFPNHSDLNQPHPFCNNANAAVRRTVWQQYRYDESLTGLEDLDFAKRVIRDGRRIAYIAEAQVAHVHEETPARIYNRYRREAIALKQIMPNERMSLLNFMQLFVGNACSDLLHASRDGVLLRNCIDILVFRAMQFWGAYCGFRQRGPIDGALRKRFYYPSSFKYASAEAKEQQHPVDYSQFWASSAPSQTTPLNNR
jgi:rhamnosyltransferase